MVYLLWKGVRLREEQSKHGMKKEKEVAKKNLNDTSACLCSEL
jgi:hypothetical protein